ncbi:MAG: SgcJ/EcaC family oxidoreductase [Intrasporangium sp.]|uniref:SgcJ/EcaC family oxidoreductase n=1 Tax=Intrasporangium sp. TaxID=1925024 RepID=UPI0026472161|nr:SgcJ/EcaC family oxidoreductase [Intrasporangium sp.]MDN5795633.1 SgcJ/EcaC family oxidoreductase [Intrasporangium sp.]
MSTVATSVPRSREEDTRAIRQALDAVIAAWGTDADAFGAGFTPDASYVVWFGSQYRGRDEIVEQHRVLFAGPLKGTRLESHIEHVQFVTDDVAVVISDGVVVRARQRRAGRRGHKIQTWVAVREGQNWHFAAFANTKHHRLIAALASRTTRRALTDPRPERTH